jgi:tRNA pseudouridine38-40 synthase
VLEGSEKLKRFRAVIEYDGTAYHGFQRQLEMPSVQGELEQAIARFSGQHAVVLGAGRTDSGVHAFGQVIAFDLIWIHEVEALKRALNANLPFDIAAIRLEEVENEFHPRYDAKRRRYRYQIWNGWTRSPLRHRQSWHVVRPLNMARMNRAAAVLEGVHDFATFGQPTSGHSTIRQVFSAVWRTEGKMLIFEIEANAFLYRMVRSLVGSMKAVGEGTWSVDRFKSAFESGDRDSAGQTAPAHGLFLTYVDYGE